MTTNKGYYSLIQYCPDVSRGEVANIGVLLFCPEKDFIKARVATGNDRISRFFNRESFDAERVNRMKEAILTRLDVAGNQIRQLEDLKAFIGTRANEIIVSDPRPVKVEEPLQDLDRLFGELVGGRATRQERQAIVPQEIDGLFKRSDLSTRIRYNVNVKVPVVGRQLLVTYAYQNGFQNLVIPKQFGAYRGLDTAMSLACEGDLLQRHPLDGHETKMIVIPLVEEDPSGADLLERAVNVFAEYRIRTVKRSDVAAFVEEVAAEAH